MENSKTAFISYSQESEEHKGWVDELYRRLRNYGVDVSYDKIETQTNTVNLNTMMVQQLQNNDFVIFVLTEEYAKKADQLKGGVGFETQLALPVLQERPNRMILINRAGTNKEEAIPFHLKGYYYIDFSEDQTFETAFEELLRRIYDKPYFPEEPLGSAPDFSEKTQETALFDTSELLGTRGITDFEKDQFLSESYKEIKEYMVQLLQQIKNEQPDLKFTEDEIQKYKHIFKIYWKGENKTGVKMWLGDNVGKGIHFLFGQRLDGSNDSSMNESIQCEAGDNGQLKLRMTFGDITSTTNAQEPKEIVQQIWKRHLVHHLQ